MSRIANGINNIENSTFFIRSKLTETKQELFLIPVSLDESYTDLNRQVIDKSFLRVMSMNTCLCIGSHYSIVHCQMEIERKITDEISCRGDFVYLTLLNKGIAQNNSEDRPIDQGKVYLRRERNSTTKITMKKGESIDYTAIYIHRPFLEQFLKKNMPNYPASNIRHFIANKSSAGQVDSVSVDQSLLNAFHVLQDYAGRTHARSLLELKLLEIFLLIDHLITNPDMQRASAKLKALERIKTWIMRNSHEEFTLRSIAREHGINELDIKRGFRKHYDTTFRQFVIEQRMIYAKKLLSLKRDNINEIAFIVGYKSTSHFIQVYKKYYGITPAQSLVNK